MLEAAFQNRHSARFAQHIIVRTTIDPGGQLLVTLEARELGAAAVRQHGDVDGSMKSRGGRDRLLPDRVHQPERPEIFEYARATRPRHLAILHPPQRVEHRFVGIRGHLDSFLKCSDNAKRHARRGLRPLAPPRESGERTLGVGLEPNRQPSIKRHHTPIKLILFNSFALLFVAFMFWRKQRRTIVIVAGALFWLLATGWLAAPLIAWSQAGVTPVEHPAMHGRTALILLGAGTHRTGDGRLEPPSDGFARIRKTIELYHTCAHSAERCTVIVSGGDPQHHGATEAETYAPHLIAGGIPPDDLILETRSRTTYENAKFTSPILRSRREDAQILVTSSYQMRRALLGFRHFGIEPQPVFANRRYAQTGWLPRWQNLVNSERALHELIGIAQFHVYRQLGWM